MVEAHIRVDGGLDVGRRHGHVVERLSQAVEVLVGAPGRGDARDGRLDDLADLMEVLEELRIELGAIAPADDVGVEHVPPVPLQDIGPALRPRVHEALGREHADRLAHHRAADAVPLLQEVDVDALSRNDLATDDCRAQLLDEATVQPT